MSLIHNLTILLALLDLLRRPAAFLDTLESESDSLPLLPCLLRG